MELGVRNLGVIQQASLALGTAMTAVTGETGAGKTMLVEAIQLLLGGRADPSRIRLGQDSAEVEGLFVDGDEEMVVRRVIRRDGPSRSYVNGRLTTATEVAELLGRHVEVHGQHSQQRLMSVGGQRSALDAFAGIDLAELHALEDERRDLVQQQTSLGGDERSRLREMDVLRFQIKEIEAAAIDDPLEDDRLEAEESTLGDALAHRKAGESAVGLLGDEGGAVDQLRAAWAAVADRVPFDSATARLRALTAELDDAVAELRGTTEAIEPDPERLAAIQNRRAELAALRRKYGDTLAHVGETYAELSDRLASLEGFEEKARLLGDRLDALDAALTAERQRIGSARRAAAPKLAELVTARFPDMAMASASLEIEVEEADPGDGVAFLLRANRGGPAVPVAKSASGGEISRVMLALRLVLSDGPPTLLFDEVDAGIGGGTGLQVGRALAAVARRHQVLVVTHLAQVAAFADVQLVVDKASEGDRTVTTVRPVIDEARTGELARMLSGMADSESGLAHAADVMARAGELRSGLEDDTSVT